MSQEFRSILAGFLVMVSHEIIVKVLVRLQSSENLTGAGWDASRMAHLCGWEVGPGCWQEGSLIGHLDLSTGLLACLPDMAVDFPGVISE